MSYAVHAWILADDTDGKRDKLVGLVASKCQFTSELEKKTES